MKRITIYDVAKEADVSLATVSRVINDSNVVREDTRLRVQQAIDKLGYKPNAIAQGLALSKTTTISIVMGEKLFSYNEKILNGLMDVAKIYNYNIMFIPPARVFLKCRMSLNPSLNHVSMGLFYSMIISLKKKWKFYKNIKFLWLW